MSKRTILFAYIITLVIGLVVQTLAIQDIIYALLFSGLTLLLSLPYLLIMIVLSNAIKEFWQLQFLHLVLTGLTLITLILIERDVMTRLAWVPCAYFCAGLLIQSVLHFGLSWEKQEKEHLKQ